MAQWSGVIQKKSNFTVIWKSYPLSVSFCCFSLKLESLFLLIWLNAPENEIMKFIMFCCNNDNRTIICFVFFKFFSCFPPSSQFFLPPIRQPYCDLRWLICTYSIKICSYTVQIDFSPWGSLFRFWCFLNLLALSCCGCAFQETNIY